MEAVTDLAQMTVDATPPITSQPAHPPYAEMINSAITALKDRDGSSRQAISKYIEKEYPNLPPTHSVMLTHHLKRLKNLGQLIMVKHSYMLPSRSTLDHFTNLDSELSSKRKPGRPPKLKPVPALVQPLHPYNVPQDLRITDTSALDFHGAEPLFASLGLADDGVPVVAKRGRGRPPNTTTSARPPKTTAARNNQAPHLPTEPQLDPPVKKQKMMSVMPGNGNGNGVRVKKARGRPRRIGIGPVTVPLSGNLLMPRPRPKRAAKPIVSVNGGVSETVSGSKRPARKFTGKRVGRPNKGGAGTAVIVTDPRQLVVYQELKSKYDVLQSKVKQVASMVRPCIDPDFGKTALGALQELEALAGGVELNNAPSHGQTQEPETEPLPQN